LREGHVLTGIGQGARRYGHEDATGAENGVDHRVGLEVLSPRIYMHRVTIT
jgi:hypothetical protein